MKKLSKNNIITIALIIAIYAIVFVLEKVIDSNSMLFIVLKKGAIYALVAVSMNLLNGFTGLFSLGQAGFMLIGAYTYAIFTIPVEYRDAVYQYFDGGIVQFSIPVIPALILAGLAAALFAFLIGLPVLRLKSDYLAIATLGFAEIIRAFFQWDTLGPVTNGSNLLRKFPTFDSTLFPFTVAGICILLIVLLINSSYGRAFKAIRDDEIAAEAMGINLFKHKEMSFVISSFFAGVGGALLAMFQTTVQAMAFKSAMTYEILLIVVIGGIGSVTGSVLASFLFIACSEWWLRFLDAETYIGAFKVPLLRAGFRKVVFSIIIMAVVLFYRQGIMGDRELNFDRILRKRQKFIEKTQRGASNMSENVLRLDHVTMQFGGVVAVNDLSMEVNDKEIVALIGPNGAGKTTAFNCITGVYEPTNGMVSFMGKTMVCNHPQGKMKKLYTGDLYPEFSHVVSPTPDQITKLGIARTFQNIRLFRSLTVFDNVLIAKHMRAKQNVFTATLRLNAKEEKRMRDEAMALLKEQHLEHLKDDIAGSLPYGLQRRLEIARALATDPKLLLLDEPAAGMNPQETKELTEFISQIRHEYNIPILMIEHHMDLVMAIAERIYVLDFGRLIASGTAAEVQDNPDVINAYLGVDEDE